MSSSDFRSWMDQPHLIPTTRLLTEEYKKGVQQFMDLAISQPKAKQSGKLYCPCMNCGNRRYLTISKVWSHLYHNGFVMVYKIWYYHGETDGMIDFGSTSAQQGGDSLAEPETVDCVDMVNDAYRDSAPSIADYRD
ncbi:unnamed protein product [Microthlaspi erraticum]|uniref:Transposase-associated domain-containing protein n=1 Tax=Microthlaspi erraticum TaxID=1685480 RepID=A0A6D2JFV8_9BRAS|nr:unnamed protein product [Microthlaspi erraticum]CAA7042364.1 unnamed protein product [Microthlaspi erraticum]